MQSRSRCLLTIHLRELELYYEASKQSKTPVFATYLLTGISAPQINSAPDVISSQELSEEIPKRLVTLATEDDLEGKNCFQFKLNRN